VVHLSVVIPTHNRRELLLQTLRSLERQNFAATSFEVVVVCDGCDDGSFEMLRNLDTPLSVRPVDQPQTGRAGARNRGVREAQADLVLFLDDDLIAEPSLIAEHLRSQAGIGRGVVIGRILPDPNARMPAWSRLDLRVMEDRYAAFDRGALSVDGRKFYTGNVSVDRSALLHVGGFNEGYLRSEDIELGYRLQEAGVRFAYNGAARVVHLGVHQLSAWMRDMYNYGRYDVRLARDGHVTDERLPEWWRQRHPMTRALCRVTVGRTSVREPVLHTLRAMAAAAERIGIGRLAEICYGLVANVSYWQGVADELGGRRRLWPLLASFPR